MRNVNAASGASVPRVGIADLERRTGTALVYGVVVLAALFAPSPTFAVLVGVLAVLAYLELRALFRHRSYQPWLVLLVIALFGAVAIAVFLEQGIRGRPLPAVLGAVITLGGSLYLGYFFGFLIELWLAGDAATQGWLGTLPVWLLPPPRATR